MPEWVITASVWIEAEDEQERDRVARSLEGNGDLFIRDGIQIRLHTAEKEWGQSGDDTAEEQ